MATIDFLLAFLISRNAAISIEARGAALVCYPSIQGYLTLWKHYER